jgi:hypothetical protein
VTTPYHPPVKRSIEIAGHKTSISLEPLFWEMLKTAARAEALPINALVARIDAERIAADPAVAGGLARQAVIADPTAIRQLPPRPALRSPRA